MAMVCEDGIHRMKNASQFRCDETRAAGLFWIGRTTACQSMSEILRNYPHFRKFVYATLRQKFVETLGELPDKDLQTLIVEEGGVPLEAFIDEIRQPRNS